MKLSNIFLIITFLGISFSLAQENELPREAQEILKKLEQFEEREQKSLERDVVKKKKELLKAVERSARKVESKGILKLYKKVMIDLEREIATSEAIIEGKEVVNFIEYDIAYHYEHPASHIFQQRGELTFYRNGKVKMQHIDKKDNVAFDKTWDWEIKGGDIIILDGTHGNIEVSASPRNDSKRIILNWVKLDKTIKARAKNR